LASVEYMRRAALADMLKHPVQALRLRPIVLELAGYAFEEDPYSAESAQLISLLTAWADEKSLDALEALFKRYSMDGIPEVQRLLDRFSRLRHELAKLGQIPRVQDEFRSRALALIAEADAWRPRTRLAFRGSASPMRKSESRSTRC